MAFVKNGRWRGRMPSRQSQTVRDLIEQQERTGEPFLAFIRAYSTLADQGRGKAHGSFTERVRDAFYEWKQAHGGWLVPISFRYKLSRKRTVEVVGCGAYIRHNPLAGSGSKGFMLILSDVHSIDGVAPSRINRRCVFAWNRIIGQHEWLPMLLKTGGES